MKPGDRYGTLTVLSLTPHRARVRCDCGVVKEMWRSGLRPRTRSCGCLRSESIAAGHRTHGHTRSDGYRSPEYLSWDAMVMRCTNPRAKSFKNYGARGVSVCERWRTFSNFFEDVGPRPAGTSLDRINNNGNYEPGNCRWATVREQAGNRRGTVKVVLDGAAIPVAEAARRLGVTKAGLAYRLKHGIPLTAPFRRRALDVICR